MHLTSTVNLGWTFIPYPNQSGGRGAVEFALHPTFENPARARSSGLLHRSPKLLPHDHDFSPIDNLITPKMIYSRMLLNLNLRTYTDLGHNCKAAKLFYFLPSLVALFPPQLPNPSPPHTPPSFLNVTSTQVSVYWTKVILQSIDTAIKFIILVLFDACLYIFSYFSDTNVRVILVNLIYTVVLYSKPLNKTKR